MAPKSFHPGHSPLRQPPPGCLCSKANLLEIVLISSPLFWPRSFLDRKIDGAVHFWAPTILSSKQRPRRKHTNSEVVKDTKKRRDFSTYITWYILQYTPHTIICRNLEFNIWHVAPNGFKFGSFRRFQRWYDRLRGPTRSKKVFLGLGVQTVTHPGGLGWLCITRARLARELFHLPIEWPKEGSTSYF